MSLRPSGVWCDVCNSPMVSEMLTNKPIESFSLSCSPTKMHAHDACVPLIEPAVKAIDGKMLPPGSPLGDLLRRMKAHNSTAKPEGE